MRINFVICPEHIEEKLLLKYSVTYRETLQILSSKPRIRFVEKGHTKGDDLYGAFG